MEQGLHLRRDTAQTVLFTVFIKTEVSCSCKCHYSWRTNFAHSFFYTHYPTVLFGSMSPSQVQQLHLRRHFSLCSATCRHGRNKQLFLLVLSTQKCVGLQSCWLDDMWSWSSTVERDICYRHPAPRSLSLLILRATPSPYWMGILPTCLQQPCYYGLNN